MNTKIIVLVLALVAVCAAKPKNPLKKAIKNKSGMVLSNLLFQTCLSMFSANVSVVNSIVCASVFFI